MKKLLILSLLFAGCDFNKSVPETQEPVTKTESVVTEEPKKETVPEVKKEEPKPSKEFLRGYWEGYHGKWWSPFHNTLSSEFRSGRTLGKKDRKQGIQPRYPAP